MKPLPLPSSHSLSSLFLFPPAQGEHCVLVSLTSRVFFFSFGTRLVEPLSRQTSRTLYRSHSVLFRLVLVCQDNIFPLAERNLATPIPVKPGPMIVLCLCGQKVEANPRKYYQG